jgi:two-component system phosphate regulon sensor histidine kinase PhoR
MNKKTIWLLVSLMTIALIGLSSFQIYWINHTIQLSNERFEKDALASMLQVAKRLEKNEMVTVAANSFAFFNSEEETTDSTVDFEINIKTEGDSADASFSYRSNDNRRIKVIINDDSSKEIREYIGDTAVEGNKIAVFTAQEEIDPDIVATKINSKRKVFRKVVEEMMIHEVRQPKRVHPAIIDSLLKIELSNHGISLQFEFGVYDIQKDSFRIQQASNIEALKKDALSASLFPNDIISNNLSLLVSFPEKNSYLLGKVWLSLLTSLIFTFTIIGIFVYVLYKIIHQKKVDDLKNDFINNMTHEFKTPIATVSLATEALQEEAILSSRDTTARYVKVIQEESARLGDQVEKVLQLASMDKDNLSLKKQNALLNEIIEAAISRAKFQVEERGGTMQYIPSKLEIEFSADVVHFSNALFNLLDNAIKYSKEAPNINLEVSQFDSCFKISIQDHGIGLTKDQQKQVFDKFYRVPTGNLHDVKGFGLGLNYAHYIITAHGGEITLESELNRGSTFTITIPYENE